MSKTGKQLPKVGMPGDFWRRARAVEPLKKELDEKMPNYPLCLTYQEQYNSGHFIQVQPLTPIVQFTGNIFDIPFHLQWSCLLCPGVLQLVSIHL
ncbi:hypothetical protein TNCV_1978921 [Trichonephila clavipes]|nr:hypothetical protein TNCV_1978921 [Trichonephila clavipes]